MKKSMPTPTETIFSAALLQAGCSVLKSFLSGSPLGCLPSSRMNSRPGPQVGSAESEQKILPPVASRAAIAAFSVDRSAGSGFLMVENIWGRRVSSELMTALDS
jgi:hypothetical protein